MIDRLSGPMLPPRSGRPPRQAVVLLHGYGADGGDLIDLGRIWAPDLPDALFVSPNAHQRCLANPAGYQWWSIDLERLREESAAGLEAARPVLVNFLIDLWAETGLDASRTVLVGFSQGAMLALHAGLSLDGPLAGIVAFSGAFFPPAGFDASTAPHPPIALIHGDNDAVVDPRFSQDAAVTLQLDGYDVTYHRSPDTGHGIAEDGLAVATAFLRACLVGDDG